MVRQMKHIGKIEESIDKKIVLVIKEIDAKYEKSQKAIDECNNKLLDLATGDINWQLLGLSWIALGLFINLL